MIWVQYLKKHLGVSHVLFLVLMSIGFCYPTELTTFLTAVIDQFVSRFDWLVFLSCTGFLLFCAYLAFGKHGKIRLGKDDERPEFSTLSWFAMLFAAGMGAGLVFYGAAEPLYHAAFPPPDAGTASGVIVTEAFLYRKAFMTTYLSWRLHAWAVYAVCALTVAFFSFRYNEPMLPSVPIRRLFKNPEPWQWLFHTIDVMAIMAILFGIVASLGQGLIQISAGFNHWNLNFSSDLVQKAVILTVLSVCYIASALSDLGKSIRILSDMNMLACLGLMVFILLMGPTDFIMKVFVTSLGQYAGNFLSLGMDLKPFSTGADQWLKDWPINYLLWWIAWGPFVGVFVARISRGRTIREFIAGVLLVPTLFSILWFSVLGGTAIYMEMFQQVNLTDVVKNNIGQVTFALLDELPLTFISGAVSIFLSFIFLVTSADSGCYVLGMFGEKGNPNPSKFQKVFWGIMIAVVTAGVVLYNQDIRFVKAIVMLGAMPYLFIMIVQCISLFKALRKSKLS